MATVDNDLTFYPAFCFKASPTHFTWVKMAAVDVHRLKARRGFEGQNIFFYQNHPIRFVYLVGILVARTDVPRRTILTLDDSSGATIDIAVLKKDVTLSTVKEAQDEPGPGNANAGTQKEMHTAFTNRTDLDISGLVPGTVIKVKGTISTFRNTIQLQLERIFAVPDTNTEMRFLDERIRFLVEVLAVPWYLLPEEVSQLQIDAEREEERMEEEQDRARRRARRRVEREEKDQRRIQRIWEREEKMREREASTCSSAGAEVMRDIQRKRARMDLG